MPGQEGSRLVWDPDKGSMVVRERLRDIFATTIKSLRRVGQRWIDLGLDPATQENLSARILRRRTGHLAGSAHWRLEAKGNTLKLVLYSAVYGPTHEFGAVIKPKRARYLTIPLPAAMTPAGVARGPARSFEGTFIKRSKAGNLVIYQHQGKGKILPLFLLKKQVEIPARHWASRSVDDALPKFSELLAEEA